MYYFLVSALLLSSSVTGEILLIACFCVTARVLLLVSAGANANTHRLQCSKLSTRTLVYPCADLPLANQSNKQAHGYEKVCESASMCAHMRAQNEAGVASLLCKAGICQFTGRTQPRSGRNSRSKIKMVWVDFQSTFISHGLQRQKVYPGNSLK